LSIYYKYFERKNGTKKCLKMLKIGVKNAFFFQGLHPLDSQAPQLLAENRPSGDFLRCAKFLVFLIVVPSKVSLWDVLRVALVEFALRRGHGFVHKVSTSISMFHRIDRQYLIEFCDA